MAATKPQELTKEQIAEHLGLPKTENLFSFREHSLKSGETVPYCVFWPEIRKTNILLKWQGLQERFGEKTVKIDKNGCQSIRLNTLGRRLKRNRNSTAPVTVELQISQNNPENAKWFHRHIATQLSLPSKSCSTIIDKEFEDEKVYFSFPIEKVSREYLASLGNRLGDKITILITPIDGEHEISFFVKDTIAILKAMEEVRQIIEPGVSPAPSLLSTSSPLVPAPDLPLEQDLLHRENSGNLSISSASCSTISDPSEGLATQQEISRILGKLSLILGIEPRLLNYKLEGDGVVILFPLIDGEKHGISKGSLKNLAEILGATACLESDENNHLKLTCNSLNISFDALEERLKKIKVYPTTTKERIVSALPLSDFPVNDFIECKITKKRMITIEFKNPKESAGFSWSINPQSLDGEKINYTPPGTFTFHRNNILLMEHFLRDRGIVLGPPSTVSMSPSGVYYSPPKSLPGPSLTPTRPLSSEGSVVVYLPGVDIETSSRSPSQSPALPPPPSSRLDLESDPEEASPLFKNNARKGIFWLERAPKIRGESYEPSRGAEDGVSFYGMYAFLEVFDAQRYFFDLRFEDGRPRLIRKNKEVSKRSAILSLIFGYEELLLVENKTTAIFLALAHTLVLGPVLSLLINALRLCTEFLFKLVSELIGCWRHGRWLAWEEDSYDFAPTDILLALAVIFVEFPAEAARLMIRLFTAPIESMKAALNSGYEQAWLNYLLGVISFLGSVAIWSVLAFAAGPCLAWLGVKAGFSLSAASHVGFLNTVSAPIMGFLTTHLGFVATSALQGAVGVSTAFFMLLGLNEMIKWVKDVVVESEMKEHNMPGLAK